MRKRDRLRPQSPAVGTSALLARAAARPTRLSSYAIYLTWRHSARKEPEQKGRAGPIPEKLRGSLPIALRTPTAARCSSRRLVGRAHRIMVDALGRDLPALASLQRLIDAHDQRISFAHECLCEQAQQHATHLPTRPASAAENSVVAMEPFVLVQAHRAQGGANSPASRSEDGACHEYVNVLEDTL
jgi:hypothetical protein